MSNRVADLVEILTSNDPVTRFNAAEELKRMGPAAAKAVSALVNRIDDPAPVVQVEVIEALGAIGEQASAAVEPLLNLSEFCSPGVRQAILSCLQSITGIPVDQMAEWTESSTRVVTMPPDLAAEIRKRLRQKE